MLDDDFGDTKVTSAGASGPQQVGAKAAHGIKGSAAALSKQQQQQQPPKQKKESLNLKLASLAFASLRHLGLSLSAEEKKQEKKKAERAKEEVVAGQVVGQVGGRVAETDQDDVTR